ncbi:hypothetical protein CAPTEDRAFT_223023, partial [Capitella teleta]
MIHEWHVRQCKVIEKIIKYTLTEYLESNNRYPQNPFRVMTQFVYYASSWLGKLKNLRNICEIKSRLQITFNIHCTQKQVATNSQNLADDLIADIIVLINRNSMIVETNLKDCHMLHIFTIAYCHTTGRTEYNSQFKRKQASKNSKNHTSRVAGVASIDIGDINEPSFPSKKRDSHSPCNHSSAPGIVMEPPLQRKKKPVTPMTTSTTQWHEESGRGSDYILLGNQGKFASNVQYNPKRAWKKKEPVKESSPRSKPAVPSAAPDKATPTSPPPAPRLIAPAPKVVVDTGAPKKTRPVKPTSPPAKKTKVVAIETKAPEEAKKLKESVNLSKMEAKKENDARRVYEVQLAKEEDLIRRQVEKEREIEQKKKALKGNYAMKYRSGVAPPRSRGPKRLSEYQLQFKWMKGVANSPLLAADQVVHKSNTQIGPYKTETANKKSEYATQFKQYQPVQSAEPARKPAKVKRSRSLEAVVSPDHLPPAGLNRVTADFDPRLVQESLNPNHFSFPHGKFKSSNSEYHRNFRPPKDYVYQDGAWGGVVPPRVEPVMEPEAEEGAPTNSWYSEVMELRKKAAEYRLRARGTHFSRSHLAQLYAQNAELWDSYSVVSALSLETGSKSSRGGGDDSDRPSVVAEAWKEKDSKASNSTARSNTVSVLNSEASESSTFAASEAGRLPTPQGRKRSSPYVRHHLDRTTPCAGGALLSTPPKAKVTEFKAIRGQEEITSDDRPASPERVSCTCGVGSSLSPSPDEAPSQEKGVQTRTSSRLVFNRDGSLVDPRKIQVNLEEIFADRKPVERKLTDDSVEGSDGLPTFGMPTRDTHELLDEEASTDRPLATHYVQTPQNARLARQKFPEADIPSTIDENMAQTFNKNKLLPGEVCLDDIPNWRRDEDALSTSVRSVASSCSVASEIFERAKKRRDLFWAPNGENSDVSHRHRIMLLVGTSTHGS